MHFVKNPLARSLPVLLITGTFILLTVGCPRQHAEVLTEQYRFNSKNQLTLRISSGGNRTEYGYDRRGFLVSIDSQGETVKFHYDGDGNRIMMQDPTGITQYYYDAFDRLCAVISEHSPRKLIVYEYDPWGYLSCISIYDLDKLNQESAFSNWLRELNQNVSDNQEAWQTRQCNVRDMLMRLKAEPPTQQLRWLDQQVHYRYDILGNLTLVESKAGVITYEYDWSKSQIQRRLPNGIRTRYNYMLDGKLRELLHETPLGQLIAQYDYQYNAAGKITSVREQTPSETKTISYDWNSRGYLSELLLPEGVTQRFQYDAMGNRTFMSDPVRSLNYQYDSYGRLTQAGQTGYNWDPNGNLTKQSGEAGRIDLEYDERGFPIQARTPETFACYRWDGDGNLVSHEVGKQSVHYLTNPFGPLGFTLAEFDDGGNLIRSYLYGSGLTGQTDAAGRASYFLEDGFNSIRLIADSNGRVIGRRDYSPYGQPLSAQGDPGPDFRMAGERYLPEIRCSAIKGRFYDPQVGRYLSPDPDPGYQERFDSFNRYTHGDPDPSNFMEPRCNQTPWSMSQYQYPDNSITKDNLSRAYREAIYNYVDKWIAKNGPGPIHLMIRGVDHRLEEGESYARERFGDHRLLVLPSYRGDGPKSVLKAMDVFKTFGERMSPFRNLDLPELWDYLASKGCPVMTSIHESGGNQDLAKNVGAIIKAFKEGRMIPFIVPTSGSIGDHNMKRLRDAGVPISESITDSRDLVGKLEKPIWETGPSKVWSSIGALFGGKLSAIPGWGYGLFAHAQHFEDLHNIMSAHEKSYRAKGNNWKSEKTDVDINANDDDKKYYKQPNWFNWPDGGGDDGGGGGVGFGGPGGFGGFHKSQMVDPFKATEKQLGGIELSARADFIDVGHITGATYDPVSGRLVLIGDNDLRTPPIDGQDLAVALYCVYGPEPQDPMFSLDPADPEDPGGPWLKAVYIPEKVIGGTHFGKSMFETDWLLKQYVFGRRVNEDGSQSDLNSSVLGYRSVAQLALDDKDHPKNRQTWARFWIVSDSIRVHTEGHSICFNHPKMAVKARKMVPDPNSTSGLRDVDTQDDPLASNFANFFTEHYDDFAQEAPEFERVRQLAIVVGLAKWMKDQNIPVDMNWVVDNVNNKIETVGRITTLKTVREVTETRRFSDATGSGTVTLTRQIHLAGGVDGTVNLLQLPDNGRARWQETAVLQELLKNGAASRFTIDQDGQPRTALLLPINESSRKIRRNTSELEVQKVKYRLNDNHKVVQSIDPSGDETRYAYDAQNRLTSLHTDCFNGIKIDAQRSEAGSSWTITKSDGNTICYKYGQDQLEDILLNGQQLTSLSYDPERRIYEIMSDGVLQKTRYDSDGRIVECVVSSIASGSSTDSNQQVNFEYNSAGNVTSMNRDNALSLKIGYAGDDETPAVVTTPTGELHYTFDSQKRLQQITRSDGASASFTYAGKNGYELSIRQLDGDSRYQFDENGLTEASNSSGYQATYSYTNGNITSARIKDAGEAVYLYDDKGRLKEMRFPDGSSREYVYRTQGDYDPALANPKASIVSVIYHPVSH